MPSAHDEQMAHVSTLHPVVRLAYQVILAPSQGRILHMGPYRHTCNHAAYVHQALQQINGRDDADELSPWSAPDAAIRSCQ